MNDGQCDRIARILAGGVVPRRTMLAALGAVGLALAARSPAVAGGKLGGAGGEFRPVASLVSEGGKVGGSMDRPARLGGKLGIGAGDD